MTNVMGKFTEIDLRQLFLTSFLFVLIFFGTAKPAEFYSRVVVGESPTEVKLLNNNNEYLSLEFGIDSIDFFLVQTSQGEFVLPVIKDFSRSFRIGEPSLPIINRIITIPYGCQLQTEVVDSQYENIDLRNSGISVPIIPVQPSLSKSEEPAQIQFEISNSIYQKNEYYRLPLIDTRILGVLRSQRLGMISFSPFEYNPVTNMLRVCKSMTVKVTFLNPDWALTKSMTDKYYSPCFDPIFQGIIDYDTAQSIERNDITRYPIKYLIIADRMFETQLQPFIEWKTKKGYSVTVAYTDVIGATSISIRNYISNLYNSGTPENPAPSFVLLVGDDQQIPAFDGEKGSHITDLHFCEFTGDYLPEIYYGRFSAQNTSQLQPQIDKTLEYERYLMSDPGYLGEVTMVSGVDAQNAALYGNGQVNYGSENYFNVAHGINPNIWLYPASSLPDAASGIIQTVNDGIGFYNYTAHCTHYGHQTPQFYTSDIDNLTNAHKYFLGIGNCCQSNTFGDNFASPCFGETFLQAQSSGGIGYIGASEDTYWDEDYWWAVGYGPIEGDGPEYEETGPGAFDGIFHDHGEPVGQHYITNAAIIMAGNLAVTESGSSWADYYWEVYHLMGDPSVMTYFGVPTINSVIHPSLTDMNTAAIVVEAVPGSYVGITQNGILHGAGYVDLSGMVTISLTPFPELDPADIVVCAQNKIPYSGTITIVETAEPYIVFDTCIIDDFSLGNGDGQIDAGEPILLGVQLKNLGVADGLEVQAVLSSADPGVTITDNVEYYGTVPGRYDVSYISDAFSFHFNADAPDLHSAAFILTVTGTYAARAEYPWVSEFVLTVHSPSISLVTLSIDDSSENGNALLGPGETAEMIITLANGGTGLAGNVNGLLYESDGYISIDDQSGFFGTLASGGEADNGADAFVVTVDPSCYPGYETSFELNLSGDYGISAVVSFNIVIGGRTEIYFDDFSSNKGWSGLGGPAEWTIGPATGGNGSDTYGLSDPEFDHTTTTDNYVLGNDLNPGTSGDYGPNLGETYRVVSPVIDCSNFNGVQLSFYRHLGIEGNGLDFASFEVFDGTTWSQLFESTTGMNESAWSLISYDLAAQADYNPNFQFRFGMGPTNGYANFCGWNIDDISVVGYDQRANCGDLNDDDNLDILDVVFLINYKYKGGPPPVPLSIANTNGDSLINILDAVYLINFIYKSGPDLNCF